MSDSTRALAEFLRTTGPDEMGFQRRKSEEKTKGGFFNSLFSSNSKKKKEVQEPPPIQIQNKNAQVKSGPGFVLIQTPMSEPFQAPAPPAKDLSKNEQTGSLAIRNKHTKDKKKRKTVNFAPSEMENLRLDREKESEYDNQAKTRNNRMSMAININEFEQFSKKMEEQQEPVKQQPKELPVKKENSEEKKEKREKRTKYRKSKFPEQMLNFNEQANKDDSFMGMLKKFDTDGTDKKEVPVPPKEETKQNFVFIDDDLMAMFNQIGDKAASNLAVERKATPPPPPPLNQNARRLPAEQLRSGEQLMHSLGLVNSLIVNGGALKKKKKPEKIRVQFSGMDIIIPNDVPSPHSDSFMPSPRNGFNLNDSPIGSPPEWSPSSQAPSEYGANDLSGAIEDELKLKLKELKQFEEEMPKVMNPVPQQQHQPRVSSPLKQSANGAKTEAKVLPKLPAAEMNKSIPAASPVRLSLDRPAVKEIGRMDSLTRTNSSNSDIGPIPLPAQSEMMVPPPPPLIKNEQTQQSVQQVQQPTKRKIKRRHIQIQARPVEFKTIGTQTNDDSNNPFDDMTKELEEELASLNMTKGQSDKELMKEVEWLKKELCETKRKLESVSKEAYNRMQTLLEENKYLKEKVK